MKKHINFLCIALILIGICACNKQQQAVEWISSTQDHYWVAQNNLVINSKQEIPSNLSAEIFLDSKLQTMQGFGTCFNELGWAALSLLKEQDREDIMNELFTPEKGANFTICRMPVGANDFSLDWYSYNEEDRDFEMSKFSIVNDEKTLIPFILNAKKYNSQLKIWASPWSPPTWMKTNKHYACRPCAGINDLEGDPNTNLEGSNQFIVKPEYLQAYALYFGKFIDAYKEKGIPIFAVAPQNEFNSCQNFPACTWTSTALADFIGNYLGIEMQKRNVSIMMGTMERPDARLVDTILQHPEAQKYVSIVGFQWAGKEAIQDVHQRYPDMPLYQTEQECGDGRNHWDFAVYTWNLMKHYISHGAGVYEYWNLALKEGGISRWGWAQNSLVVVDTVNKQYRYTPDYYVFKHITHYVLPGAKHLATNGYENMLAFQNPDGNIVVIIGNFDTEDHIVTLSVGKQSVSPLLKAGSLNSLVFKQKE